MSTAISNRQPILGKCILKVRVILYFSIEERRGYVRPNVNEILTVQMENNVTRMVNVCLVVRKIITVLITPYVTLMDNVFKSAQKVL